MYFFDDFIDEVRSRNDIVEVISQHVKLQKKGASYFGLCPFHNEKSPSFSVSGSKQMFYCFGCGEGGNVISFLMKYENMSFTDAVSALAERAGMQVPEAKMRPEEKRKADLKNAVFEANAEAARYYHHLLFTEEGQNARDYFEKRQLGNETITSFGLGVSGMRSAALYRYMKEKGYEDDVLRETGLFVYDEHGVHDRFRNRVMFPIINVRNKVIGFGGRVMGDGQPKYLNSPETEVFDKGHNLYGINAAKSSRTGNFIICEGYMDVISMHQAGFTQAVASLGTAFTMGQAMLIKRYVKDVLVCYDSDGAGVKAALRSIGIFREAGLNTRVINMEPYKDADEFIKAAGREEFQKRIDNAEDSFMFRVRIKARDFDFDDPAGKTQFFNEVAAMLCEIEDEVERDIYLDAVSVKYMVSREGLKKLVIKHASKGVRPVPSGNLGKAEEKKFSQKDDDALHKAQKMILTWICDSPGIYQRLKPYISPADFSDGMYRKLAEDIFERIENGNFDPASILNRIDDTRLQNEAAGILNTSVLGDDSGTRDREKAVNEAVQIIRRASLDERSRNASDMSELQKIITEQRELSTLHISLN